MPEQLSPDDFAQLLESYESALRLSAVTEVIERRRMILEAYEAKQLEDGEFRLEGNLFGAWMVVRGRLTPRQARNPEIIVGFLGELVGRMVQGLDQVLEAHRRRSIDAAGN